jgi:plasmid stability protein
MVNLRIALPESLHEAVKRKAAQDDRSMNAYVRHILREATGAYDRSG